MLSVQQSIALVIACQSVIYVIEGDDGGKKQRATEGGGCRWLPVDDSGEVGTTSRSLHSSPWVSHILVILAITVFSSSSPLFSSLCHASCLSVQIFRIFSIIYYIFNFHVNDWSCIYYLVNKYDLSLEDTVYIEKCSLHIVETSGKKNTFLYREMNCGYWIHEILNNEENVNSVLL